MSLDYKIIVQEEKPNGKEGVQIWIKPSISEAYIRFSDWISIAGGGTISGYDSGTFDRTIAVQSGVPSALLGQIWQDTVLNALKIYLDDWYTIVAV